MRRSAGAFTLVELLVVIAIISTLAAVLFPLISRAKATALKAACSSQMRQVAAATNLYASDYDDVFMPISYQPASDATSRNDRTWVQLVLPYIRTFSVFRCPADTSDRQKMEATFDQDLVPGDTASQYYRASLRTNFGFNYQYLSPIQMINGVWQARPRSLSQVASTSGTLLYLDSVWNRSSTGAPIGGGSWLVTPPCRFYAQTETTARTDSFTGGVAVVGEVPVFTLSRGWNLEQATASNVYGNAWPWHFGRINMAMVDGSVRSIDPSRLAKGCELRQNWQGSIDDADSYLWDLK